MRLGFKLAALGFILLLPKTQLYLSGGDDAGSQVLSEQAASCPPADGNVVLRHDPASDKCATQPLTRGGRNTLAVHSNEQDSKGTRG